MSRQNPKDYRGPALFSYGFRPFFLSASVFAGVAVLLWMRILDGRVTLAGPFAPTDWHIHEMLFGYAAAVIAGFLFTAIPNWTGRMPKRGWPLILLVSLWIAGRLAVAGLLGLGPVAVLVVDSGFLASICLMVAIEIFAGRNWRNLMVVIPVFVLFAANLAYHLEALLGGGPDIGRRLAMAIVVFLIMLIGGRVIPSFTRNWLVRRDNAHLPVPFNRFDAACLAGGAVGLLYWSFAPQGSVTAGAVLAAALLHAARLARWQGGRTWPSPLLLMLHVAYGFIPAGLAAVAAGAADLAAPAIGAHLLGIGAIGGMTLAVMIRASLGHTGQALEAGPFLTAAAVMVFLAAVIRACLPAVSLAGVSGLWAAALLWIAGFAIFVAQMAPHLARTSRKPT